MIHNLKYNVTFASTLKTFTGDHNFQMGTTAITGPNESGKSLIVEMIRYTLFGTKALRASASGYQKLTAELVFTVKDKKYTVTRNKTGSDAIHEGKKQIVSGTKPVNEAIETILGYNMEVFDVSNACLQGQVDALSKKTPAERKRMVDKAIGLDTIDELIKKLTEEISNARTKLQTLQSQQQSPEEPEKPERIVSQEELDRAESANLSHVKLQEWLVNAHQEEPNKPTGLVEGDLDQLEAEQKVYNELKSESHTLKTVLENLTQHGNITTNWADREEAVLKWEAYKKQLEIYQKPPHSLEELQTHKENLKHNQLIMERNLLNQRIAGLESNDVQCPKCDTQFALEHELLSSLKEQLATYPTTGQIPPLFDYNQSQTQILIEQWERYNGRPEVEEVENPHDSMEKIRSDKSKHSDNQRYLEVEKSYKQVVKQLNDLSNNHEMIESIKKSKSENDKYQYDKVRYDKYIEKKAEVDTEIMKLQTQLVDDINELRQARMTTVAYDTNIVTYQKELARELELTEQVSITEKDLKNKENARNGLKDLKPKVKMFLVPSLNKVSSTLISQMTQGERSQIVIDEQFNIKVDGQGIEELSGSGQSVANLAIRIGLGTVLTNKVFSVFLADEVDAAMDENRAAYTAECLRNLNKTIGQIIIVSHQNPEADNRITLCKT